MTHFENPIRLVKELKGAPLSVLMLIYWAKQPVSQGWLQRNSGYSDKPVSEALGYLEEHGFIRHARKGWLLADGSQQLPLPLEQVEEGEDQGIREEADIDRPGIGDNGSEMVDLSRNYSDSITTTTSIKSPVNHNLLEVVEEREKSRNFSESGDEKVPKKELSTGLSTGAVDNAPPDVWDELAEAGITRNRRTEELMGREYVTPAYVRAHRLQLEAQGKRLPDNAGLLITIMERGDPAPALNSGGHLMGCRCYACASRWKAPDWMCDKCFMSPCRCDEEEDEVEDEQGY